MTPRRNLKRRPIRKIKPITGRHRKSKLKTKYPKKIRTKEELKILNEILQLEQKIQHDLLNIKMSFEKLKKIKKYLSSLNTFIYSYEDS